MSTVAPSRSEEVSSRTSGLAMVLLAVLVYSSLHIGFRLLASSTLGEDDVYENLHAQFLWLGYVPRQPPLYDWVLWAVQRVMGPTPLSFLVIKYGALTATAGFLYLATVRILGSRVWGFLAVESMALIYQISWRVHEGFTHEMGAMVAVAATFWVFLRVCDFGRVRDFLLLGLTVGLGLLTEPAFYVFLLMLGTASSLQPALRARLWRPMLLVTFAIALSIASPYYLWLVSDPAHFEAIFRPSRGYFKELLLGVRDALRGPFFYLSPLIVFLPFVFPGSFRAAIADVRRPPNQGPTPDFEQMLLHLGLAGVVWSLIGAVLLGISNYPIQVLMPLYLVTVIWLLGICKRAAGTSRNIARFTMLALTIAVIAFGARLLNMFVHDPVCKLCRWGIPYEALATEIRKSGFDRGTIVAVQYDLAGNLRTQMPEANLVMRLQPDVFPPDVPLAGNVAFVWGNDKKSTFRDAEQVLAPHLPPGRSASEARLVKIPWTHLWRPTGYRTSDWHVLVVDFGQPQRPR